MVFMLKLMFVFNRVIITVIIVVKIISREASFMARRQEKVSEDSLQALVENWNNKDVVELSEMLGVEERVINYWAMKLRKSMKDNGLSDDDIRRILPAKRRVQGNVYDRVAKRYLSPEQAPKRRGRKPKQQKPEG